MDSWASHYLFCEISFVIGKNLGPTACILSHNHNGYYAEEVESEKEKN